MPLHKWHELAWQPQPPDDYAMARSALQACPAIGSMERAHKVIAAVRAYLAAVPAPAEPTDEQRSIAFNYAEGFATSSTVTTLDVLDAYCAIRDAAPAAEPVAQPRNSSLPATAEDKTIYDRIAANYAAPVAQQPLRDIVFDGPDDPHRLPAPQPEAPVAQQPPPREPDEAQIDALIGALGYSMSRDKARRALAAVFAAQQPEAPPALPENLIDGTGCDYMRGYAAAERDNASLQADEERARIGWDYECDDLDRVLARLGLDPQAYRTDGGRLNRPKLESALAAKDARIESDAKRIRTLEADLGRYMMLANTNAADIATSRERERALHEALREECLLPANGPRRNDLVQCLRCGGQWTECFPEQHKSEPHDDATPCLATPDSAAEPIGGEG